MVSAVSGIAAAIDGRRLRDAAQPAPGALMIAIRRGVDLR
jgi:hypothetical protein